MHTNRFLAPLGTAVSLLLTVSCGSSNDSPQRPGPVPIEQLATSAASALCGGYSACCASKGYAFNAESCNTSVEYDFDSSSFCLPPSIYDPQAAADCFAAVRSSYASCLNNMVAIPACKKMCVGTKTPGTPCSNHQECAIPPNGAASCNLVSNVGVCVVSIWAKLGDTCDDTCTVDEAPVGVLYGNSYGRSCNYHLPVGSPPSTLTTFSSCRTNDCLFCNAANKCAPILAIGARCAEWDVCQAGAHCNLTVGQCQADITAGGACSSDEECAKGNYCANQLCAAKKATGESCTGLNDCVGACDQLTNHCIAYTPGGLNVTADICSNPNP